MDSGFLAEGESLEDTFDVMKELLPEEIVGLMDQMLCHEVRLMPQHWRHLSATAYLILILGPIDGMAYGSSAFDITLHLVPY